ncbi:hypothetical protein GUJ93_ZPchr0009g1254 [Zizania palustris]|uniref:Uncharacterized protein n=1 Tax=Zizania palustris TaxID=103762 RepID=A0A8J5RLV0_ZIZPA|nr:hypothetical protein GUJ93_ZPchr0009g1254 [Zizania palustris]
MLALHPVTLHPAALHPIALHLGRRPPSPTSTPVTLHLVDPLGALFVTCNHYVKLTEDTMDMPLGFLPASLGSTECS